MKKLMVVMASLLTLFGCRSEDRIVSFSLSKSSGRGHHNAYRYEIRETEDGQVHFLFNEDFPDEKEYYLSDHSVFDSLDRIVRKYHMNWYRSDYRPRGNIKDGSSWSLDIVYASGKEISSGGYMAGPCNWGEAREDLLQCLDYWKSLPGLQNDLVSFEYFYGTTHYLFQREEDHTTVTIDDEAADRHVKLTKPLDLMEDLRKTVISERLRDNGCLKTDDPNSTPFKFESVFSNGDKYCHESYDLEGRCHYTEVLHGFLDKWEIN